MGMIGNSLAQGLISGANIQDGTVDTPDIKDGAITLAKHADGSVSPAKLSTGAPNWDSSGNFGVGVTPSASNGGWVELANGKGIVSQWSLNLGSNWYYNGTNNIYKNTGAASYYNQNAGQHIWYNAPSGTAGNAITFTQAMMLDASGNLGVNSSAPACKVDVNGIIRAQGATISASGEGLELIYTNATPWYTGNQGIVQAYNRGGSAHTPIALSGSTIFLTTGASERARIDSSGNFLVGTTTANTKFVFGATTQTGAEVSAYTTNTAGGTSSSFSFWRNYTIGSSAPFRAAYIANINTDDSFNSNNSQSLGFFTKTGTAEPYERVRITSTGIFSAGDTPAYLNLGYFRFNLNKAQGTQIFCISAYPTVNEDSARFYSADGTGMSGSATAMHVAKNSSTNRSINAAGTINASGADYAEYMTKASDFILAKGDVAGVDEEGKLTNVFADAVSFVIKSTDPSYVGGDTWFTERQPVDEEMKDVMEGPVYDAWVERREAARALVDRVAFAGQVPVNVTGATPGQYIIPVDDNGAIKGEAVSNPTFEQYQLAVGKVIAIEQDGRARIIVKVA